MMTAKNSPKSGPKNRRHILFFYTKIFNYTKMKRENFIFSNLKTNSNSKVLLLGAHEKAANKLLKVKNLEKIYLVDITKRIEDGDKFITKQADLNVEIPFDDDSFDFIIADQVIEHLTNIDTFLEEIHRTLKRRAIAIISTENLAHFRNIVSLVLGYSPMNINYSTKINVGNPLMPKHQGLIKDVYMCHHKVSTPKALEELLIFNKFKIIKSKYLSLSKSDGII